MGDAIWSRRERKQNIANQEETKEDVGIVLERSLCLKKKKKKIEKLESQKGGKNIQGQGLLNPSQYYTGPLFETAKEKTKVKLFCIP